MPSRPGKNVGWTDWTHVSASGGGDPEVTSLCDDAPRDDSCHPERRAKVRLVSGDLNTTSRLLWRWVEDPDAAGGPASGWGDPRSDTEYALCVYDTVDGVPSLEMSLPLPTGAGWRSGRGGARFHYKRKSDVGGKLTVDLRARSPGRTRIRLKAHGSDLSTPAPANGSLFFRQDPLVIVQAVNDDEACWSSQFGDAHTPTNKGRRFNSKSR